MSDEKTVETFGEKLLRMFVPQFRKRTSSQTGKPDIETIDPLERFEKAIKDEFENKSRHSDTRSSKEVNGD